MIQEPTKEELNLKDKAAIDKRNGSFFLFNCLVWIAAVSPLYFPEDQQKEARVLIKEVKEKLRKLRSMLGNNKGETSSIAPLVRQSQTAAQV